MQAVVVALFVSWGRTRQKGCLCVPTWGDGGNRPQHGAVLCGVDGLRHNHLDGTVNPDFLSHFEIMSEPHVPTHSGISYPPWLPRLVWLVWLVPKAYLSRSTLVTSRVPLLFVEDG